jgi:phosphoglycolate phosphatase-like HAD superfamily hydrolase
MLAVIDLDGVLADVRHRLRFVETRPKDWRAFFAAAADDPVLEEGRRVVAALAEVHDVVYLSGRPEYCRDDTIAWLQRHGLPEAPIHLRPWGDHRPARDLKVALLRDLAREREIAVLVDDDVLVCDAARAAGFDVLPATWMGEAPTLLEAQEVDGQT